MTKEEAKQALNELKKQGYTEEIILKVLYLMYQHDEMDLEALESLVNLMGYEFNDEFINASDEDKKKFAPSEEEIENWNKGEK